MKRVYAVSLRFWLPALAMALFTVFLAAAIGHQYWLEGRRLERRSVDWARFEMAQLQPLVEKALLDSGGGAETNPLAHVSTVPAVDALGAVDGAGRILLSQRYEWRARPAAEVLGGFDASRFARLQREGKPLVELADAGRFLTAYYPLSLPNTHSALRSPVNGALYLRYDLGLERQGLWSQTVVGYGLIWVAGLVAMAALVVALRWLVVRPVRALVEASGRLAEGDSDVNVALRGPSELARLGDSFNRMVRRVKDSHGALLRQRNLYSLLSQTNQLIVRSHDEAQLFDSVCRITLDYEGFQLAWVGLLEPVARDVRVVAGAGAAMDYLRTLQVSAREDVPTGRGPAGTAIREGHCAIFDDFPNHPAAGPWAAAARRYGLAAVGAFPIRRSGEVVGVLAVYGDRPGFFDESVVALISEMAEDISFALDNLDRETARRAAERELKEREKNLAITLDSIGDGVIATDAEGRITRLNPVAQTLTGWPAEQALGRPVEEVFHIVQAQSRAPQASPVQAVLRTAQVVELANHTVLIARNGAERPIADTAAPIRDEQGRVGGVVLVFHDVSRQYAVQQALRRSQAQLRHHMDNTPLAAVIWDKEFRVVEWNRAAERMFGYSQEEAVGRHGWELIVPDSTGREVAAAAFQALLEGPGGERSVSKNVDKQGRALICEWYHTPLTDENGKVASLASLAQDISERHLLGNMVRTITQDVAAETGRRFLESLVRQLADALEAEFAYVGELAPDGASIHVIAVYAAGQTVEPFTYALADTPCRDVIQSPGCASVFPDNVCLHYPGDAMLRDMAAQSYAAAALTDGQGRSFGIVGVVGRRPMEFADLKLHVLRIFAVRAAAELQRMRMEEDLRLAATTFESHEAILIMDRVRRVVRVNRAFSEVTGFAAEEVLAQPCHLFESDRHSPEFYAALWGEVATSGRWQGEMWSQRVDGGDFPAYLSMTAVRDTAGETSHYVCAFLDFTEQKRAEGEIHRLAYYDALTGLPNRRLFLELLGQELSRGRRHGDMGALLFLDLDQFKTLNDSLGHGLGDLLLKSVAERVGALVRSADSVARLGGDEFVVILTQLGNEARSAASHAQAAAEKILEAVAEPYQLEEHGYHVSTSIGVALFGADDSSAEDVLKQADVAMYRAKAAGRNNVCFYTPAMQEVVDARLALEKALREAVHQQRLRLEFQPQIGEDGILVGAEALIRWERSPGVYVSPAEFIPVAEETGMILPLGTWIMHTVCQAVRSWIDCGWWDASRHMAVNISPRQFHQADFVDQVRLVLDETGLPPACLTLELTEGIVIENVTETTSKMKVLKGMGVHFSVDDFGTGYSSLSYLKRLPLDQLKIDRSFVQDIPRDTQDMAIVQTIISMAKHLGFQTIAEGVETQAQWQWLRMHGCAAYQGYYFSRPLGQEPFEAYLRSCARPAADALEADER